MSLTAPKPPEQRRRRNVPERGEWVDLEPIVEPVLEEADPSWSLRVQRLWNAWRIDPVSTQWGVADREAVWNLANEFDELAHSEQRLRMDSFGLTPKGKRDLRWRTPQEVETIAKQAKKPRSTMAAPLKLVGDG